MLFKSNKKKVICTLEKRKMMYNESTPVVLCEDDHKRLCEIIKVHKLNPNDETLLAHEIKRAIIVRNKAFPINTIRIDSYVKVLEKESGKTREFQIVMPEEENLRKKRISVFSARAIALIGFRIGDEVIWEVPYGLRTMKILDVENKLDNLISLKTKNSKQLISA